MTVVDCPVCGVRVNALAAHCPECAAVPTLSPEAARADLLARGLSGPPERHERRVWSRRRRIVTGLLAALVALVLLAPLWLGYFGPETAVWARVWRPWRSEVSVELLSTPTQATASDRVRAESRFNDPWPGEALTPGSQQLFHTVERPSPLLPWIVTATYTGG